MNIGFVYRLHKYSRIKIMNLIETCLKIRSIMVNLPKSMLWTTALKLPSQYPELSSQYPREQNYQNVTLFINLAILVTNLFKFILNRAQAKRGGGERILVKIC